MHKAGHAQAVLGLLVQDAVPARDDRARLIYLVIPAAQDGLHCTVRHGFRHAQQVERGFGLAAHGVDVGQRVRRRDLSEQIGIVRDGREKVHGLHERELVRHAVDRRVVALVEPDEQVWVAVHGQPFEQLGEHARADLGPAPCAARQLGQFDLLFHNPSVSCGFWLHIRYTIKKITYARRMVKPHHAYFAYRMVLCYNSTD